MNFKIRWQGWYDKDHKDLIFIMVPRKGNAQRRETGKGHSEIWNRFGKKVLGNKNKHCLLSSEVL